MTHTKTILTVQPVYTTTVVSRPSKVVRSPYMADVINPLLSIDANLEKNMLAHAPSLGVSGLVSPRAQVVVSLRDASSRAKSKLTIEAVMYHHPSHSCPVLIGVNPLYANALLESILRHEWIPELLHVVHLKREVTVGKSRFDFGGVDRISGKQVYIEVKTVPLVNENGIAIFPDGYRKKKGEPVSVRAVKHLNDMAKLSQQGIQTYMVYVIQRDDAVDFAPADTDPVYVEAYQRAKLAGVQMMAVQVSVKMNASKLSFVFKKSWIV